jgi:hypothetical protein
MVNTDRNRPFRNAFGPVGESPVPNHPEKDRFRSGQTKNFLRAQPAAPDPQETSANCNSIIWSVVISSVSGKPQLQQHGLYTCVTSTRIPQAPTESPRYYERRGSRSLFANKPRA